MTGDRDGEPGSWALQFIETALPEDAANVPIALLLVLYSDFKPGRGGHWYDSDQNLGSSDRPYFSVCHSQERDLQAGLSTDLSAFRKQSN